MDAAKQAVSNFTSRKGHTTEVDELVQPGITSETVKPHRHEETTHAIDREVHQHHHHTTVQPITHQEVLPEKHTHNLHATEEREFIHGDPEEHKRRLAAHAAQFKDTSVTHDTRHTTSAAPAVTGEHVHHHVHEIVQPVIHKETIQPQVVHTTHPVHEVHHHHATHHGMSALPMKTLDEFKGAGGVLTGSKSNTHEKYEGEPRPYNKDLETTMDKLGLANQGSRNTGMSGNTSSTGMRGDTSNTGMTGNTGMAGHKYNDSGVGDMGTAGRDSGIGASPRQTTSGSADNYDTGRRISSEQPKKQSLISKLNPLKDSDGDGKKGFMT